MRVEAPGAKTSSPSASPPTYGDQAGDKRASSIVERLSFTSVKSCSAAWAELIAPTAVKAKAVDARFMIMEPLLLRLASRVLRVCRARKDHNLPEKICASTEKRSCWMG